MPGAWHDAGAARERAISQALAAADVRAFADTAYVGAGHAFTAPFRRVGQRPGAQLFARRELSAGQKAANRSISEPRAPAERANAALKSWRVLRKIRSSPAHATLLVNAVQVLIVDS